MAEKWTQAFGRYLRALRERRGLSLEAVASLSQAFAETLNKGYLSRCENGRQRIAFSKIIPLSRIYEVPADVLLERMELDLELDRVGGPVTEGLTFEELTKAGTLALNQGYRWKAYGCLRDAVPRAATDSLTSGFRNVGEQIVCSYLSAATAAAGLGRFSFALYETLFVERTGRAGPRFSSIVLQRLSFLYRNLGRREPAREYARRAIVEAEQFGETDYLGYVYENQAILELEESNPEVSVQFFKKAHEAFRKAGRQYDCARELHNLAQVYFDLGRYRAARRALLAADRIVQPLGQNRTVALGRILMGEIDAIEKNDALAESRWKEAISIAKDLNDKVLRFKAEYLLFRQAFMKGDEPVARAIQRRLIRLSNWVPKNTPELRDFQDLMSKRAS